MNVGIPFIGPLTREDTEVAAAAEDAANRELVQGVLTLPRELFAETIKWLISLDPYDPYPGLDKAMWFRLARLNGDIEAYLRIQELQKTTGVEIAIPRKPKDDEFLFYRLLHLPGELFAKIIGYLDLQDPADRENGKIVCCMYYGDSFDPKLNCLRYLESPEFKKHLMELGFSPHFLDRMQAYLADAGKGSEEDRIACVVRRVSRLLGTLKSERRIHHNVCVKPDNIKQAIDEALQNKKLDEIRGRVPIISMFQKIVNKCRRGEMDPPISEDLIKSLETMVSSTDHSPSESWWSGTFFPWILANCNIPDFKQLFNFFLVECMQLHPSYSDLWFRSLRALPVAQEMGWFLLREMMLQAVKDNDNSRLIEIIQCVNKFLTIEDSHLVMSSIGTAIQRAIEFDYRECLQTLLLDGGGAENNEWHRLILLSLLDSNRGYRLQILSQLIPYMKGESYNRAIQWALINGFTEELNCLLRPDNINRLETKEAIDLVRFCIRREHGFVRETVISQVKNLFHAFQKHNDYQTIVDEIENFLVDELRDNSNTWWLEGLDVPNKWTNNFIYKIVLAIIKNPSNQRLISKLCNLVNTPEKRGLISTETMDKIQELSNSSESLEPLRQALKAGEPQSGDRTLS